MLVEIMLDSLGNMKPINTDTAEIVLLTPDTLVLRFSEGERSYYHKTETAE